jgi:predicted RNase H-like HicB family nuclease
MNFNTFVVKIPDTPANDDVFDDLGDTIEAARQIKEAIEEVLGFEGVVVSTR